MQARARPSLFLEKNGNLSKEKRKIEAVCRKHKEKSLIGSEKNIRDVIIETTAGSVPVLSLRTGLLRTEIRNPVSQEREDSQEGKKESPRNRSLEKETLLHGVAEKKKKEKKSE